MAKKSPEQPPSTLENTLTAILDLLSHDDDARPLKPSELTDSRLEQHLLLAIHRHRASLDWLIDSRATGRIRPRTRRVLWWALVELLHSDGVQPPSLVNVAVAYVRRRHAASEAGFVNAFLRRLTADLAASGREALLATAPEHVRLELPQTLWQRWRKAHGAEATRAMATAMLVPAPIVLRVARGAAAPDHPALVPLPSPDWAPDARLLALDRAQLGQETLGALMARLPQLYIQDPATLLAPALLHAQPGETVADLCAAPGGKARLIAEDLQGRGALLCRDRAPDKLERLRNNLAPQSAGLHLDVAAGDAAHPDLPPASCHAVLLDVPCSNTGVLRRKPDAKWSFSDAKLAELTRLQAAILDGAAPLVAPTGRLVYSACSVEPDENDRQVQDFLRRHPDFRLVSQRQLLPSPDHDGAFAALLVRHNHPHIQP